MKETDESSNDDDEQEDEEGEFSDSDDLQSLSVSECDEEEEDEDDEGDVKDEHQDESEADDEQHVQEEREDDGSRMDVSSQSATPASSNIDSGTTESGRKSSSYSSKKGQSDLKLIFQPQPIALGEILSFVACCEEPVPAGEVKREMFDVTYTNGDRYFGEMDGTRRH
eukprot:gene4663-5958_t